MRHPLTALAAATLVLTASGVARAQSDQSPDQSPAAPATATQPPAAAPTNGASGYSTSAVDLSGLSSPGLGASALALPGFPAGPGYLDLQAGAIYTDNALLTATDRQSTGIGMAGVDVDYNRAGSELTVDAIGNVDWLDYFDHAVPSAAYGNFNGTAIWGHTTDLFQWMLRDTYTEGEADPLAAPTLAALEEVNYFTTGPYLNFNFGPTQRLTAYGLYSNTSFQSSPFGSETYNGGAIFTHALSTVSNVALQLDDAHTDFTQSGPGVASSGYDMRTAQLIYSGALARTEVSAAAGYSTENYGGPTRGSPVLSLSLTHSLSPSSSIFVRGQDGYTTFGNAARLNLSAPLSLPGLFGGAAATTTAAPFKDEMASAGWTYTRARTTFALVGTFERQLYVDDATFNSNNKTVSATLIRRLRPTLTLRLSGFQTYGRYSNVSGKLTSTTGNLSVVKQFRRLNVTLYVQRTHQDASANSASLPLGYGVGNYNEDRIGLSFAYDLIGHRYPALQ